MIQIVNIGPEGAEMVGLHDYVVRINGIDICKFQHIRKFNGLAECLRDAADAIEKQRKAEQVDLLLRMQEKLCR